MSMPVIAAIAWAVILGGVGGFATTIGPWYRNLTKPAFQPPDWLFGPAWTLILGFAAWAAVLAWNAAPNSEARAAVITVYAVNFVFHFLWSPLFFKLRRPDWALVEVVFLWGSVLALWLEVGKLSSLAGWLTLPYLLWVSFAAFLNFVIVRLNRPFEGA